MHRRPLLDLLAAYLARHASESATVARMRELIATHADCLTRACAPGHVTASAWVLAPDRRRFLLLHHKKLGKWLQPGGHVDGEPLPHRSALREVEEETGLDDVEIAGERLGDLPLPFDLDVHFIPRHGDEAGHEHHDVRYLLIARRDAPLRLSDESRAGRWFEDHELETVAGDESVLRLGRKARKLVALGAAEAGA